MSYIWQVAAPGLGVAIAFVGSAALLAPAMRMLVVRWKGELLPAQAVAMAGTVVLAVLLNANAWLPGEVIFPTLMVTGGVGLAIAIRRGRGDPLSRAVVWAALVTWLCSTLLVAAWTFAFAGRRLWMLEGTNHDLVFFYGGAKWAMQHSLAVSQSTVQQVWELGRCGEGMHFIGNGCVVQRNGAYTLLALASYLTPHAGPNAVRAMIGTTVVFPILGLLPAMGGRFSAGRWWPSGGSINVVLSLVCMGSCGMLMAITNENIGTAVAAAVLAMLVLWALTPMQAVIAKLVMLGMIAGCAGLIYGEAAVDACVIVAIAVFAVSRVQRSWKLFVLGGSAAAVACLVVLNHELPELYSSFVKVSGIVGHSEWASWYIQHRPWWWLGAPFAGFLMGGQPPVAPEAVLVGVLLMAATCYLSIREKRWRFYFGFLLFSSLLVIYIELHEYQYGEHKLIQILGPAWVAMLTWLLARHVRRRGGTVPVLLVIALLAILPASYMAKAKPIIDSHTPFAITRSLGAALQRPEVGDEVVIDGTNVQGPEKYIKQDFAIVELHQRGVRARVAATGRPPVGYSDQLFEGSLSRADTPDWLLVLRHPGASSITLPPQDPVAEDATYALYSLDQGRQPLVVAGSGWASCEAVHCPVEDVFTLETVIPRSCVRSELHLSLGYPQAPQDSEILVTVNDEKPVSFKMVANSEIVTLLPAGASAIRVEPNRRSQVTKQVGQPGGSRKFLASVDRVTVQCGSGSATPQ